MEKLSRKTESGRFNMKNRIYIIGVSTSGKTTLAKKLAKKINCECFNLDDLYWKKKYTRARTKREMESIVKSTIKKKKWVIEGSYSEGNWVRWIAKKSDAVLWLDIPRHTLTWRIIKRPFTRQKPNPKHSRINEIFVLLRFLKRYKTGKPQKIHQHLVETHPRGYILKSNRQINKFIRNFK